MAVLGTRGGWKERSSPACPQTSADALRMGCKSRSEQGLCGTRMHRIKRKHKPNFLLKPPFFPCRPLPASMMPSDMRMATCARADCYGSQTHSQHHTRSGRSCVT